MATKRLPKPDASFVYALYRLKLADGDESRLRRYARLMRQYTTLVHRLNVPDSYKGIVKEVRSPFLRDAWHRTSTALNQRPYVVEIEPRDKTNAAERAAEIGIRWDNAVREALDKEISENTAIESTKALVRDGESVLKVVHRPDAWANFPEREDEEDAQSYSDRAEQYKKGAPLPFAWRVVDRLSMMFGDGEFGDDWALEYGEYPRPYLGQQYGMIETFTGDGGKPSLINPRNRLGGRPKPEGYLYTPTGRAVKLEYWNADWWHVVVDGEDAPGFPKPNPYAPRLPYFRAKGPDSESLLYSLMPLMAAMDELLTMKLNWAYLGAYPNPIVQQVPNAMAMSTVGDADEPTPLTWKPGKAIQVPIGLNMSFLSPPPIGKDLNDMVGLMHEMIDVAGIPSVLRGVSGSGDSGYLANQMIAAAMMHLTLAADSLSHQFEKAFEFLHWLVAHKAEQCVYVLAGPGKDQTGKQWLGLKPDGALTSTEASVEDLGPVTVEFRPTLPTDEQARAMIATQLTNPANKLVSQRYALEHWLMVEDADAVMDEIAVEKALESPPLANMWMQRALEEAGLAPPTPGTPPPPPPATGGQAAPPGIPGQAAGGIPSIPGLTMPVQPPTPAAPNGLRPAGAFPGQPPNPTSTAGGQQ